MMPMQTTRKVIDLSVEELVSAGWTVDPLCTYYFTQDVFGKDNQVFTLITRKEEGTVELTFYHNSKNSPLPYTNWLHESCEVGSWTLDELNKFIKEYDFKDEKEIYYVFASFICNKYQVDKFINNLNNSDLLAIKVNNCTNFKIVDSSNRTQIDTKANNKQ